MENDAVSCKLRSTIKQCRSIGVVKHRRFTTAKSFTFEITSKKTNLPYIYYSNTTLITV
jgi:hypothetical protein